MKPVTRWGTAADVRAFCGADLPASGKVRVAEVDGRVVGLAGWYLLGAQAFVFSKVSPEMKRFPRLIVTEAKRLLSELKIPAMCAADPEEPTAPRFLERLGWVHVGQHDGREVYAWQTR